MRLGNFLQEDANRIAREFPNLLRALHHRKILITGGTGFLGRWVLAVLDSAIKHYSLETEIYWLNRNAENNQPLSPAFHRLQGDIKNFECPEVKFDFILHMAASANPKDYSQNPKAMEENIILGAKHIFSLAEKNLNLKKILMVSSGAVYGKKNRTDQPMREDLIPDLLGADIYSKAKYEAEKIFTESQNQNIPWVIARSFAFYGETQPVGQGFAVADLCDESIKKSKISIKNLKTIRSFMYAGDWVRALLILFLTPSVRGIFNVGGEHPKSILETACEIRDFYNLSENPDLTENKNLLNYYVPLINKLKGLGFVERFEKNKFGH